MPGLVPLPRHEADGLHAEVLWVDRFGNCQLNVGPAELAQLAPDAQVVAVTVGDERHGDAVTATAHGVRTFAELGAGALGLVLDSHGMYALVLDQRSAAAELALAQGDAVRISVVDDAPGAVVAPCPCGPNPMQPTRSNGSSAASVTSVRPATTLTLGLLLVLILVAGIISLIRI